MKKVMNQPDQFVDDSLRGLLKAYPGFYFAADGDLRAIGHAAGPRRRVAIVTGGGYGHLPVFLGYVGDGLCDGVAVGNVFTSPSSESILNITRAVSRGHGVLYLFGNYFGDGMNFDMAAEILAEEGVETAAVKASDDVASAPREAYQERRGVGGIVLAYKVAGACADTGAPLAQVAEAAQKAVRNTSSFGVAFSSCVLPGASKPIFTIDDNDMEVGMGIHGEPGVRRSEMKTSREIAEELVLALCADQRLRAGDRVALLANGLGATSREELYLFYGDVYDCLDSREIVIAKNYVGEYATSMEMAGLSLSVMKLDEELESLLEQPAFTPFAVL